VLWSGPDDDSPFMVQARELLTQRTGDESGAARDEVATLVGGNGRAEPMELHIPEGAPFDAPEHEVFRWDVALTADDLVGLLGTLSWIITMAGDQRERITAEVRRLLRDLLGVEGDVTVDVGFRSDTWRAQRR